MTTSFPLNFFSSFNHVDWSHRTGFGSTLNHAVALVRDGQRTLHDIGLFNGDLPIPVLHGPGEIEILPFLGYLHLSLWPGEFRLLKLSILLVDHESPKEIKPSADDAHLLWIEQLKVLRDGHPWTLYVARVEKSRVPYVIRKAHKCRMISENVTDASKDLPTPRVPDLQKRIDIASIQAIKTRHVRQIVRLIAIIFDLIPKLRLPWAQRF